MEETHNLKVKVKQSGKFTFNKLISTLIKKYIINIFKEKSMFCNSFWSKGGAILQYHRM